MRGASGVKSPRVAPRLSGLAGEARNCSLSTGPARATLGRAEAQAEGAHGVDTPIWPHFNCAAVSQLAIAPVLGPRVPPSSHRPWPGTKRLQAHQSRFEKKCFPSLSFYSRQS